MRAEFGHLILLAMILMPSIVVGSTVSWRIRSPFALFVTIGSSLPIAFIVSFLGALICNIIAPFFPFLDSSLFRSEIVVYIFLLPTGLVSGAILSGMLLLVQNRLKRTGKKLDFSSIFIAVCGSVVVSIGLSLLLLVGTNIGSYALLKLIAGNQDGIGVGGLYILIYYGLGGILALVGALGGGLFSAIAGVKLANILR